MAFFVFSASATEVLLVNENFQGWESTFTSPKSAKTIQGEDITYTWSGCVITKDYVAKSDNGVTSAGAINTNKGANDYFEISGLPHVTRFIMKHSYTGGSRGCIISVKVGNGAWEEKFNANATAAAGQSTEILVNGDNVSIRFASNTPTANYAYLHDLIIYGQPSDNVAIPPTIESVSPSSTEYLPTSGSLTITFSEAVTRNTTGDITIGNITILEEYINIVDKVVTIMYSGLSTDNTYKLTIPAGAFKNATGTATATVTEISYKTPDTKSPTISKNSYADGATIPESGIITLVLSEIVTSGNVNVTLGSKSIAATAVAGKNIATIGYSGLPYGENITLSIPQGALRDVYGNTLDKEYTYSYTVEEDTKGSSVIDFSNPLLTEYSTTGAKKTTLGGVEVTFDIDAAAAARNSSGYTSAVKCNTVTFAKMGSVGHFQFYIQNGNGADVKEFYVEKQIEGSWQRVETFIVQGNGAMNCVAVNAKSSDSVELRIAGETTFWLYQVSVLDFKDNSPVDDGQPPYVVTSNPTEGSSNIAINGTINLKFNKTVTLGTGNIMLNGKALTPNITGSNVTLPYLNLAYATSYTLTISAGALKDKFNHNCNTYTLTFTTKAKPAVSPKLFDKVVAKDGSGDYTDIQAAFNAVPNNNAVTFRIFVKNGTYNYGYNRLTLAASKTNVTLIGQSREGVIITGDNYVGRVDATKNSEVPGTNDCAVIDILSNDFYGENFTVINTAGIAQTERAVCIRTRGDRVAMNNVSLLGGQDILYTNGSSGTERQYYKNSSFSGTVDYIFGGGDVLFDNCEQYVVARKGADATKPCVITAPSTNALLQWGYVFVNNTINGDASQDGVYQLGRPWQNAPRSVWINTTMNVLPVSAGWGDMQVAPALFAEYNSVKGSGIAVDISNRKTQYYNGSTFLGENTRTTLTEVEVATYTPENIFGAWDAVSLTEATAAPSAMTFSGDTLGWSTVDGASCYIILHGDTVVAFSTTSLLTGIAADTITPYYIQAATATGALSALSEGSFASAKGEESGNNGGTTGVKGVSLNHTFLQSTLVKSQIELVSVEVLAKIDIYDISGRNVLSRSVTSSSIDVGNLRSGLYFVVGTTKFGTRMVAKILKQ